MEIEDLEIGKKYMYSNEVVTYIAQTKCGRAIIEYPGRGWKSGSGDYELVKGAYALENNYVIDHSGLSEIPAPKKKVVKKKVPSLMKYPIGSRHIVVFANGTKIVVEVIGFAEMRMYLTKITAGPCTGWLRNGSSSAAYELLAGDFVDTGNYWVGESDLGNIVSTTSEESGDESVPSEEVLPMLKYPMGAKFHYDPEVQIEIIGYTMAGGGQYLAKFLKGNRGWGCDSTATNGRPLVYGSFSPRGNYWVDEVGLDCLKKVEDTVMEESETVRILNKLVYNVGQRVNYADGSRSGDGIIAAITDSTMYPYVIDWGEEDGSMELRTYKILAGVWPRYGRLFSPKEITSLYVPSDRDDRDSFLGLTYLIGDHVEYNDVNGYGHGVVCAYTNHSEGPYIVDERTVARAYNLNRYKIVEGTKPKLGRALQERFITGFYAEPTPVEEPAEVVVGGYRLGTMVNFKDRDTKGIGKVIGFSKNRNYIYVESDSIEQRHKSPSSEIEGKCLRFDENKVRFYSLSELTPYPVSCNTDSIVSPVVESEQLFGFKVGDLVKFIDSDSRGVGRIVGIKIDEASNPFYVESDDIKTVNGMTFRANKCRPGYRSPTKNVRAYAVREITKTVDNLTVPEETEPLIVDGYKVGDRIKFKDYSVNGVGRIVGIKKKFLEAVNPFYVESDDISTESSMDFLAENCGPGYATPTKNVRVFGSSEILGFAVENGHISTQNIHHGYSIGEIVKFEDFASKGVGKIIGFRDAHNCFMVESDDIPPGSAGGFPNDVLPGNLTPTKNFRGFSQGEIEKLRFAPPTDSDGLTKRYVDLEGLSRRETDRGCAMMDAADHILSMTRSSGLEMDSHGFKMRRNIHEVPAYKVNHDIHVIDHVQSFGKKAYKMEIPMSKGDAFEPAVKLVNKSSKKPTVRVNYIEDGVEMKKVTTTRTIKLGKY